MSIAQITKFRIRAEGAVSIVGPEVSPHWHSSTIRENNRNVQALPASVIDIASWGMRSLKHEK